MGKYLLDSILPTDQTLNVAEQEKILRLLIKKTPDLNQPNEEHFPIMQKNYMMGEKRLFI